MRKISSIVVLSLLFVSNLFPQPTITSFSPTSGQIGNNVVIYGNGFSTVPTKNIVYFGLARANVLSATTTQISVTVPQGCSSVTLSVIVNGLKAISSYDFAYLYSNPLTLTSSTYGVPSISHYMELPNNAYQPSYMKRSIVDRVDLNNDGIKDDITIDETFGYITIQFNQVPLNMVSQSGYKVSYNVLPLGFQTSINYSYFGHYFDDINGDGLIDIILAEKPSNSNPELFYLKVYLNRYSSNQFAFDEKSILIGANSNGILFADIDKDGLVDFFSQNSNLNLNFYRNTSSGNNIKFDYTTSLSFVNGRHIFTSSDIDNDGKPDLIAWNYSTNGIEALKNNSSPGNISFDAPIAALPFSIGSNLNVVVSDLDGDLKKDIIAYNFSGTIAVAKNTSSSSISFAAKKEYSVNMTYSSDGGISVSDMNGDGKPEIIHQTTPPPTVGNPSMHIYLNKIISGIIDSNSFQKVSTVTNTTDGWFTCDDINSDGVVDIYVNSTSNSYLSAVYSSSSTFFSQPTINVNRPSKLSFAAGNRLRLRASTNNFTPGTGNLFNAELSDQNGSFNSHTLIGTSPDTSSSFIIDVTFPSVSIASGMYKIRITSTNPSNIISNTLDSVFVTNNIPVITGISGSNSDVPSRSKITLTGTNLVQKDNLVYLGSNKAQITKVTPGSIETIVPEGSAVDRISFHSLGKSSLLQNNLNYSFTGYKKLDSTTFGNLNTAGINLSLNASATDIRFIDYNSDSKCDILVSAAGNRVYINNSQPGNLNSAFSTTSLNNNSSTSAVEVADLNGDGKKEVIEVASTNNMTIGNYSYTTLTSPVGIAIADMDNDGNQDVVVLSNGSNSFSVFRNNSIIDCDSIIFYPRQDFTIGTSTNSTKVLLADIDLDGKTDVITSNTGTSTFSLFQNTTNTPGVVTFATPYNLATPIGSKNPVLADLNKDGKMDIIIADQTSAGSISFYINNSTTGALGSSTFLSRKSYTTGFVSSFINAADGDGDGMEDVFATIPNGSSSKILFFKNNYSSGAFDSTSLSLFTANTSTPRSKIYFADLNLDGRSDMVLVNQSAYSLQILPNLLPAFKIVSNLNKLSNGDSIRLKFTSGFSFSPGNTITVYISDSTGSFSNQLAIGTKSTTASSDSIPIVIPQNISGNNFRFRLSSSSPAKTSDAYGDLIISKVPEIFQAAYYTGRVGDTITIQGNSLDKITQVSFGTVDANIISAQSGQVKVQVPYGANFKPIQMSDGTSRITTNANFNAKYAGSGTQMNFISSNFINAGCKPSGNTVNVAVCDFDKDGDQDLIQVQYNYVYSIYLMRNVSKDGVPLFRPLQPIPYTFNNFGDLQIADLDNDGYSDIIVSNGISFYFLKNRCAGNMISFDNPVIINSPVNVGVFKIVDINNDNKSDLVVSSLNNTILVFLNMSNGTNVDANSFALTSTISVSSAIKRIQVKDLNNDGFNDIVYSNNTTQINILISNALKNNISFSSTTLTASGLCKVIYLDDINQDGKVDILTGTNSGRIMIFRNNFSSGTFSPAVFDSFGISIPYYSYYEVSEIMSADMDFDGKNDLLYIARDAGGSNYNFCIYKNIYNGSVFNTSSFAVSTSGININRYNHFSGNLEIADMNLDQRPDIIYGDMNDGLVLFENIIPVLSLRSTSGYACRGKSLNVNYSAAPGIFNSDNVFSIQISDSSGRFDKQITIGSKLQTTSDFITLTIPSNLFIGGQYQMRVVSSNPFCIGDTAISLDLRNCPSNISFYPDKAEPNSIITITGNDLSVDSTNVFVYFGTAKGQIVSASGTQWKVKVPASATYGNLFISCNGLNYKTTGFFTPVFRSTPIIDTSCISSASKRMTASSAYSGGGVFADLDGDGVKDLMVSGGTYKYGYASATDSFTFKFFSPTSLSGTILDLNGDGTLDMANTRFNTNCTSNNIYFVLSNSIALNQSGYYNPNSGSLNYFTNSNCYSALLSSCAEDLDRDGMVDIIAHGTNGPDLAVFKINPTPWNPNLGGAILKYQNFGSSTINPPNSKPIYITTADIDGDSIADVINETKVLKNTSPQGSNILSYLTPAYNFLYPNIANLSSPVLITADLNSDGKPDIIYYNAYSISNDTLVRIMENTSSPGNVSFGNFIDFYKRGITLLKVCDYNGDGKPDIVISTYYGIYIYKNISSGSSISFQIAPVSFKYPSSISNHVILDIFDADLDKRPDILIWSDSSIYMLKNLTPLFIADLTKNSYCQDDSIYAKITISNKPIYSGNQFILQLSDLSGSFVNAQNIGSQGAINYVKVGGKLPLSLPLGNRYRLRIISTNPPDTSYATVDSFSVYPTFKPLVLSNNSQMGVCFGDSVILRISNPDTMLTYQWRLNQSPIAGATQYLYAAKNEGLYSVIASGKVCSRTTRDTFVSVYALPVAKIMLTPLPVLCLGDSVILNADTVTKYKYQWLLNNTYLTADTFQSKIIKSGGSYTLVVTDSHNCIKRSRDTIISVVSKPTPVISSSKNLKLCSGDSLILSGNSGSKFKYYWRLNGAYLMNDTLQNLKVKVSGGFSLKIIDSNYCYNISQDTIVIINNNPSIALAVSKASICPNDSSLLILNQGLKFKYTWLKNNQILASDSSYFEVIKSPGVYAAIITDSNQCSTRSSDATINVYNKVPALIMAIRPLSFCFSDSTILMGTTGNRLKYLWKKNGVANVADSLQTIVAKTSATYSLAVIDTNNCVDISRDTLTFMNSLPVSGFTVNNLNQCLNANNFLFTDTSTISSGTLSRTWNFGDTTFSTLIIASKSYSTAKTYSVKVVSTSNNNCVDSITKTITVNPQPGALATATGTTTICQGSNVNLVANTGTGLTYRWRNDSSILAGANNSSYLTTVSGNYSVIVANVFGCADTSNAISVVVNALPVIGTISGRLTANVNDTANYMVASNTGNSYLWGVTSGTIQSGQGTNTINLRWITKGTGNVKLVVTNSNTCSDSSSINVTVMNTGIAELSSNHFSVHPNPASNELIISNDQSMKGSLLVIHDMLGRKVLEQQISNDISEYSLSINELKTGAYFLTILKGDEVSRLKFLHCTP